MSDDAKMNALVDQFAIDKDLNKLIAGVEEHADPNERGAFIAGYAAAYAEIAEAKGTIPGTEHVLPLLMLPFLQRFSGWVAKGIVQQ